MSMIATMPRIVPPSAVWTTFWEGQADHGADDGGR